MTNRPYTEEEFEVLRKTPKQVRNPGAKWKDKPKGRPGHRQQTFNATGGGGEEKKFLIYLRQNLVDRQDFSCGIAFLPRGESTLTLARYNGPSHDHGNISHRPHIHQASEKAIAAGQKAEWEAEETTRYKTLSGTLACLISDYNVAGIVAGLDQSELF